MYLYGAWSGAILSGYAYPREGSDRDRPKRVSVHPKRMPARKRPLDGRPEKIVSVRWRCPRGRWLCLLWTRRGSCHRAKTLPPRDRQDPPPTNRLLFGSPHPTTGPSRYCRRPPEISRRERRPRNSLGGAIAWELPQALPESAIACLSCPRDTTVRHSSGWRVICRLGKERLRRHTTAVVRAEPCRFSHPQRRRNRLPRTR